MRRTLFAVIVAVLLGLAVAGSVSAAEQRPDEMIVAMASSKIVCGGNTGRPCPGTAPATTPPVAAAPVIPAPKPAPVPATSTPLAAPPVAASPVIPAPKASPTPAPSTTPTTALTTISSGGPAGYTFCANENSNCSFGGAKSVAYGANGKFNSLTLTGGTACTNAVFSDPLVGTLKACYLKDVTGSTPAPTISAPTPISAPVPASTPIATTPAPVSTGTTLRGYAADPVDYTISFAHIWWATSINKMLVFYGDTNPCCNPNSVRAFDPVSNTWEDLWPNGPFNGGPQTRDNHASFYIPRIDELWVWGGSHLDNQPTVPNPLRSGRFRISQKQWITTSTTDSGAFTDVVIGTVPFTGADPATAWSASQDMGIIFGGSAEGNASNDMYIFEPNSQGPQPYKVTQFTGPRPPPRAQAENIMAAAGSDFYLYGGTYQVWPTPGDTGYRYRSDLWKFNGITRTWTQLQDAPGAGNQSILTYDSDRNALVAWVNDKIYVYAIASGQWSDQTPVGLPCISNQVGVYAPTARVHLFEGGNRCSDGASAGSGVYGISLSGTATPLAAISAPAQPAVAPTLPAPPTFGHVPSGYFDSIAADGTVSGWSYDPDTSSQSNDVQIYADGPAGSGTIIGTITTNKLRSDVNAAFNISGNHGFTFSIPSNYTDGKSHQYYIYGIDKTGDANFLLTNSPKSFTLGMVTPPPPPTPVPTPTPFTVPTPTSPPPVAGWLNIPVGTWISRPYPPNQLQINHNQFIGQRGFGVNGNGGVKHERLVYNPDNKRVYFYSGDFPGDPFNSSFHTDMYSYDITKSVPDTSDNQNWILEWPYCGLPGQTSPVHTDEAPFSFDTKHHIFWITGGFEVSSEDVVGMCGNGAIFYGASGIKSNADGSPNMATSTAQHSADILTFDPATNRYSRPPAQFNHPGLALAQDGTPLLGGAQTPRHSIYNPVTNEIISLGQHGGWGNYVIRMNTDTGVWTRDGGGIGGNVGGDSIDGSYINDTIATHEDLALDVEHQWVYWIDTYHKQDPDPNHKFRLMRYDITNHSMATMGWITMSNANWGDGVHFPFYAFPYDSTTLSYDPINKVVLWAASSNEGRPILFIYHPDPTGGKNGNWEIDPMNRDKPNEIIFGSNGTFIPELNALIIYGGFGTPHSDYFASYCPSCNAPENYFWLYRYGNGK